MSEHRCQHLVALERLIAYQLGELSADEQDALEDHYFACEACSARLEGLYVLGREVAAALRRGSVSAPVSAALVERARAEGLHVREYRVSPSVGVACTALPEDDFVLIHLEAGLDASVDTSVRMRVQMDDLDGGGQLHREVTALPVDAVKGDVYLLFSGATVRDYPRSRWTMHLELLRRGARTQLGPFTLEHTPYQQLPPS